MLYPLAVSWPKRKQVPHMQTHRARARQVISGASKLPEMMRSAAHGQELPPARPRFVPDTKLLAVRSGESAGAGLYDDDGRAMVGFLMAAGRGARCHCRRSSVVEHTLGRNCLPGEKSPGLNRSNSGNAAGREAHANPEPSSRPRGKV